MIPIDKIIVSMYLVFVGCMSEYSPGVFEQVLTTRQAGKTAYELPTPLPEVDGYIAVQDCSTLGEIWRVWNPHTHQLEKLLVADCGGPHIRESDGLTGAEWMVAKNVVGEVDWSTARRLQLGTDRTMVVL